MYNYQGAALPKSKAREVALLLRKEFQDRGVSIRVAAKEIGIGKATIERIFADCILSDATLRKIKKWAASPKNVCAE